MAAGRRILKIDKQGNFTFQETLLVDYRRQNLGELLQSITDLHAKFKRLLFKYMHFQNRLLGQEKANLARALHSSIRYISAMYLRLFDAENEARFSRTTRFRQDTDGLFIAGPLVKQHVHEAFSINVWTEVTYDAQIANLLALFAESIKDGQITLEEKVVICRQLTVLTEEMVTALYMLRSSALAA